jgi:hypothetical protein
MEMNGCFAPHTRRAMVETRPGKFLVDLFSTIDYACVEHKTSESPVLDVNNLQYFIPVNSEINGKFGFCWQSFDPCGWIVTLLSGFFIFGLLLWCLTACPSPSGWVKTLSLPSSTRRGPSMSVTSSLMTDRWCHWVLGALKWCIWAAVSKMSSTLDYQHSVINGMIINQMSSTT